MERRVMNWGGVLLILAVLLAAFLTTHLILKNTYASKRAYLDNEQRILTQLEEENRQLESMMRYSGTENYIVSSAMSDYGYMNKNDIRFEVTNPEALYGYTEEELRILVDEMAD